MQRSLFGYWWGADRLLCGMVYETMEYKSKTIYYYQSIVVYTHFPLMSISRNSSCRPSNIACTCTELATNDFLHIILCCIHNIHGLCPIHGLILMKVHEDFDQFHYNLYGGGRGDGQSEIAYFGITRFMDSPMP